MTSLIIHLISALLLSHLTTPSQAFTQITSTHTKKPTHLASTLTLTDLSLSTSGTPILQNIHLQIHPKERWGIVGPNGCGKSTLLKAIVGSIPLDGGSVEVGNHVKVGYLRQTAVSGSTKTVREEAASEMMEINEARCEMDRLQLLMEQGDSSEQTLNALSKVQARFESLGGYRQESTVDSILKGLGFQPPDSERLCADFSGGWQMRIALARLLLSNPDLLLLDEPSNHLDSSARDWLGNYLNQYQGSMVLVSHDVNLLKASVNSIGEVSGKTLVRYVSCGWDKYLVEKEERKKGALAEYERNVKEAARLQGVFIFVVLYCD